MAKNTSDREIELCRPRKDNSFPPALSPTTGQILNDRENSIDTVDSGDKVRAYLNEAEVHMTNNDLASARKAIKEALSHAAGNPQLAGMLTNMLATLESR